MKTNTSIITSTSPHHFSHHHNNHSLQRPQSPQHKNNHDQHPGVILTQKISPTALRSKKNNTTYIDSEKYPKQERSMQENTRFPMWEGEEVVSIEHHKLSPSQQNNHSFLKLLEEESASKHGWSSHIRSRQYKQDSLLDSIQDSINDSRDYNCPLISRLREEESVFHSTNHHSETETRQQEYQTAFQIQETHSVATAAVTAEGQYSKSSFYQLSELQDEQKLISASNKHLTRLPPTCRLQDQSECKPKPHIKSSLSQVFDQREELKSTRISTYPTDQSEDSKIQLDMGGFTEQTGYQNSSSNQYESPVKYPKSHQSEDSKIQGDMEGITEQTGYQNSFSNQYDIPLISKQQKVPLLSNHQHLENEHLILSKHDSESGSHQCLRIQGKNEDGQTEYPTSKPNFQPCSNCRHNQLYSSQIDQDISKSVPNFKTVTHQITRKQDLVNTLALKTHLALSQLEEKESASLRLESSSCQISGQQGKQITLQSSKQLSKSDSHLPISLAKDQSSLTSASAQLKTSLSHLHLDKSVLTSKLQSTSTPTQHIDQPVCRTSQTQMISQQVSGLNEILALSSVPSQQQSISKVSSNVEQSNLEAKTMKSNNDPIIERQKYKSITIPTNPELSSYISSSLENNIVIPETVENHRIIPSVQKEIGEFTEAHNPKSMLYQITNIQEDFSSITKGPFTKIPNPKSMSHHITNEDFSSLTKGPFTKTLNSESMSHQITNEDLSSMTAPSQQQHTSLLTHLSSLRVVLLVVALLQAGALGCRISEFTCGNYECVPADAYCDGHSDCSDRTDEPRDCSPCNRTFYGDVGRSYEVSVHRPTNMLTSFTCHLTFVAEGDQYGDIVQLIVQDFKLGDFFSYNSGCPQGWMQISERDRPYTDGYWCGDSNGFNVYYSETSTTTLTLKKFITMDYIHFEGLHQSPFNFRLSYKTLRRSDAVLRYGNTSAPKDRGELSEGSLCDRIFLNCDEYRCSVQSPNFPGLYPRHVTCHYLIRQTRYVPFARPLITISQDNPLKFNVKSTSALPGQESNSPTLQIWGACDLVHDHLSVYDGNSTDAPLFLKFCGSGQLPPITSTGSDMLIIFSTSRFDEPNQGTTMPRTFGFELNVNVTYESMDSWQFARNRQCVFHIFATNNSSGEVLSVINTQPPNSSCVYLFHGEPYEKVWIHFRKYEINPKMGHYSFNMTECINPLRIYDGNYYEPNAQYGNPRRAPLIQEHCTSRPPPMCAREYLPPRLGRISPVKVCTRNESYVTSGPKLTVVQHYNESTAALAMDFVLRYEFVDTRPGYHPTNGSECDFEDISDGYSLRTGRLSSPTTSVLYGRWGRRKISCQYRLTAHRDEVVRVTITKFHSVSRSCVTTTNNFTKSYDCDNRNGQVASLVVSEYPWQDIEVPRLCICDYSTIPIEYESKSQELRLKFEVNNMDETHDHLDFMFEAQYEFVKKSSCKKEQRLQGTNGEIVFRKANLTENKPCDSYPWLLQTSDPSKSIYFRIRGYDHIDKNCTTTTRLLVFKVGRLRPVGVLCPDTTSKKVVELYSFAWQGSGTLVEQSTDKLVLEVLGRDGIARDYGPHILTWLQVSPARQYDWSSEGIVKSCKEECPELGVCISQDLWCDGVHHCPSGHDELIAHCFFLSVPWAYIGVGSALSIILLVAVTVYGAARLRQADKKNHNHQPIPTLPTASESLFSSDKDMGERDGGVTSVYSLDYSEVDYVTTL